MLPPRNTSLSLLITESSMEAAQCFCVSQESTADHDLNWIWKREGRGLCTYNVRPIAEKAELLLLELRELAQAGPRLRMVHRFQRRGTECRWGEEVFAVYIVHRGRATPLSLPLALRLLLNYLAQHRHQGQSAAQISAGIRSSLFYRRHAANSGVVATRRISRSAVKEYIKRIRQALSASFKQASLALDPARVLVSQKTQGNEVQYRLRATLEWVHLPSETMK